MLQRAHLSSTNGCAVLYLSYFDLAVAIVVISLHEALL